MSDQEQKHAAILAKLEEGEINRPISQSQESVPASAQVILEDRYYYRTFAKWSFYLAFVMSALVVVLAVALAISYSRPPLTLSYLQDANGNLVTLRPLDQTELTEAEILDWAAKRILDLQRFSFVDYRDHLIGLSDFFVPEAFNEYQKTLIGNKTIDRIKNDRLVKYAEPAEAPVIQKISKDGGVLTWVITMKIRESMAGGEYSSSSTDLQAEITIVRSNQTKNLDGIQISRYLVTKEGKSR